MPLFGLLAFVVGFYLIFFTPQNLRHFLQHGEQTGLGWFMVICSIIWVGVGLINFLPKACFLHLTEEGMTAACLFLSFHLRWENVRLFRVARLEIKNSGNTTQKSSSEFVVADVFDTSRIQYNSPLCTGLIGYVKGPKAHADYMRSRFSADAMLATNYGLTTEALAELLNEWRLRKAGSAPSLQGMTHGFF